MVFPGLRICCYPDQLCRHSPHKGQRRDAAVERRDQLPVPDRPRGSHSPRTSARYILVPPFIRGESRSLSKSGKDPFPQQAPLQPASPLLWAFEGLQVGVVRSKPLESLGLELSPAVAQMHLSRLASVWAHDGTCAHAPLLARFSFVFEPGCHCSPAWPVTRDLSASVPHALGSQVCNSRSSGAA